MATVRGHNTIKLEFIECFIRFEDEEITFSNVHNGIGVVGAVSASKAQINIPPLPGGKNADPGY